MDTEPDEEDDHRIKGAFWREGARKKMEESAWDRHLDTPFVMTELFDQSTDGRTFSHF